MRDTKYFQSPFHSTATATSNSSRPYLEHDSYITMASQYFWVLWCGVLILGSVVASRQQAETKAHMTKWGLALFAQLRKEVAKNQLWPLFTYGHRGITLPDSGQSGIPFPQGPMCAEVPLVISFGTENGTFSWPQACEVAPSNLFSQVPVFSFPT